MGFLLETFWDRGGDFWGGGIRLFVREIPGFPLWVDCGVDGWGRRAGEGRSDKKERDGGRVSSVSLELSGGYLLSHRNSTIGVTGLNFSVRNGKRWIPGAIATLYDKKHIGMGRAARWCPSLGCGSRRLLASGSKGGGMVPVWRIPCGGRDTCCCGRGCLPLLFGRSWFVLIGLFILRFLDDFVW